MKLKPVAWMLGRDVTTNEQMGTVGWPAIGCGEVIPLYAIPPGYALVPVEPTARMIEFGVMACLDPDSAESQVAKIYKAMLTTAKGE